MNDVIVRGIYPLNPGHKRGAPETSSKAGEAISSSAATLRDCCMVVLKANENGLTADEVAAKLGVSILAIRPRISELRKLNRIIDTGTRRQNASGHSAVVWSVGSAECRTPDPSPPRQEDVSHSLFDNTPVNHGVQAIKGS